MLFDCLREVGVEAELVDVSPPSLEPSAWADRYAPFEAARPTARILIWCLPPLVMLQAFDSLSCRRLSGGQRVIGYWAWETTAMSPEARIAYDHVDEVWASSTFLYDVYRGETSRPVRHVPLHVGVEPPQLTLNLAAHFDSSFTILSVFDFHSRIERKNPLGSIAAFRRAFPRGDEHVKLLLKTINGERRPDDLARVLAESFGDPRIVVLDGAVHRRELCGLIAASDVYLSLHRSEGFGRPIAEAMLLNTPVVATRWSGTADFVNDATAYPIRSDLRPVRSDEYPNAAGYWAEPDVGQAAERLAFLYAHPQQRNKTIRAAREQISTLFGRAAVCETLLRA